jgi:ABC-type transporter Mla subunit MlaD
LNCSRGRKVRCRAVSAAGFSAAGLAGCQGIRILLESSKAGQLSPGDPVLFRGYRVGSVETSTFDAQKRVSLISCLSMRPTIAW